MKTVSLIFALLSSFAVLMPAPAVAAFDTATTVLARTYSPALSINPEFGYGVRVWGSDEDPKAPWYGFVRPVVTGVLSPSLYEGKIGVELFPVSILGVELTRTSSRRFRDTEGQECTVVQCQGPLDYTDVSLQSYLGVSDYFTSIRYTRTFYDAVRDTARPVYELGASILLRPTGDAVDFLTVIAGRNFDDRTALGVLLQTADGRYLGQHQEAQYVILRSDLEGFGWPDFDATVGLGRYKSDLNIAEFSAVLSLTYTGTRAIGLGR